MRSSDQAGWAIILLSWRGNSRRMMLPGERGQHHYFFIIFTLFLHFFTLFA